MWTAIEQETKELGFLNNITLKEQLKKMIQMIILQRWLELNKSLQLNFWLLNILVQMA